MIQLPFTEDNLWSEEDFLFHPDAPWDTNLLNDPNGWQELGYDYPEGIISMENQNMLQQGLIWKDWTSVEVTITEMFPAFDSLPIQIQENNEVELGNTIG